MTDETPDPEHVDPQDEALRNSPVTVLPAPVASPDGGPADVGVHIMGVAGHAACYWNDKQYSDGGSVCDAHIRYKCWNGQWVEVGQC